MCALKIVSNLRRLYVHSIPVRGRMVYVFHLGFSSLSATELNTYARRFPNHLSTRQWMALALSLFHFHLTLATMQGKTSNKKTTR